MKIKYLGTAAAEGVPAIFCKCDVCKIARKNKGKDIRTRSQSIINDDLLIDFPGDAYLHALKYDIDYADFDNLIITHGHSDHFYAEDLAFRMNGYSNDVNNLLNIYGNERVQSFYNRAFELEGFTDDERLKFNLIKPFETFKINNYTITPLLADHDKNETCLFYIINDGEKTLLYAHDTGYFPEVNWEYFEKNKIHFDFVSLDCTHQKDKVLRNHMSLYDNINVKNRMKELNMIDDKTILVCNHFSHNGGMNYEEFKVWAEENGFITAYDGLEIEF